MNKKSKTTINDIAKRAGVSIATVSRALNNSSHIDKKVQLRIKNIAETLNYNRYLESKALNSRNRNMKFIGVLLGKAGGHLVEQIEHAVRSRLKKTNYYELRYLIDEPVEMDNEVKKELFIKNILSEKGVVGILSMFIKLSDVSIANLNKNNLPVVLLNNYTDFGKCVTIDNFKATCGAVKKLIELGRKKIACIMPNENIAHVWTDRIKGYKKALFDSRIRFDPALIMYENDFYIKQSASLTKKLITENPKIDAIIYGGDLQAYGGIKILKELGIKIPEDIAVIGFDDLVTNTIISPSLSSVRQPMYEMGKIGIDMLINAIENRDYSHEEVILNSELKLRKSCLSDYKEELWNE